MTSAKLLYQIHGYNVDVTHYVWQAIITYTILDRTDLHVNSFLHLRPMKHEANSINFLQVKGGDGYLNCLGYKKP